MSANITIEKVVTDVNQQPLITQVTKEEHKVGHVIGDGWIIEEMDANLITVVSKTFVFNVDAAACFIAGTLVATLDGFKAIEEIKVGDTVLSADTDTMQVGYKQVLETYVRKVHRLVHLIVNGEEIVTTVDHPFYVKGQGFINAAELCIGSELVDNNGNTLLVEQMFLEELHDETVDVYNFQVEDYHTYFVGDNCILVHNAGDGSTGVEEVLEGIEKGKDGKSISSDELVFGSETKICYKACKSNE